MKRIAILGSTGSIGRSTLNVIESNPERFQLLTMAAGSNTASLNGDEDGVSCEPIEARAYTIYPEPSL